MSPRSLAPVLLFLAACSSAAYAHVSPTGTAAITTPTAAREALIQPYIPPTPMLPLSPAPPLPRSPAPVLPLSPAPSCPEHTGLVIADQFNSETLGYPFKMQIYLPPCYEYEDRAGPSYPVLYLLHGLNMDETAWDEIGVDETADALIESGEIPPLIIVMPRERNDDRFGDALVSELIPFIEGRYDTLADRDHRALGGISRGAGWAAHIGFQHPDLFGALGMHSLAIFYSDESRMSRWIDSIPLDLMPRIYLDIGKDDSLTPSAEWLDTTLTKRGIEHEYRLSAGSHTRAYWTAHLPEYLRWYTAEW